MALLDDLVEQARKHTMTPEQIEEQWLGFAYGNAPNGDRHTPETIHALLKVIQAQAVKLNLRAA